MVLKDDYGKDIIKLNSDEFIYKCGLRKIVIKKSDIRSLFYDNDMLGILTYEGKIHSLSITSLLFSERVKLEELRNELNKENILFNFTKSNPEKFLILISFINILNLSFNNNKHMIFIIIIILVIILFFIYEKLFNTKVLFNIDKDEFEITRLKKTIIYSKYEVDKIQLKKYTNELYLIEFKKNKNKYKILFRENPYLMKIYNVSLSKLFDARIKQ